KSLSPAGEFEITSMQILHFSQLSYLIHDPNVQNLFPARNITLKNFHAIWSFYFQININQSNDSSTENNFQDRVVFAKREELIQRMNDLHEVRLSKSYLKHILKQKYANWDI